MKRYLLLVALLATVCAAFAIDVSFNAQGAYYIPNHAGYGQTGFATPDYSVLEGGAGLRDLGSTWGGAEAKISLSLSDRVPFMVGENSLFAGNNIRGKFTGELSPVSMNALGQISLTPIAFLVFDAGAGIGSGWSMLGFKGLGINNDGTIELENFGGAVWRIWGAGTFQFDVAALVPGEWNHVVLLASAKLEYEAYTGASADEAWLWEADDGENFNGLKYYGTYVLAYQMPLMLNMVGMMVETEEWIDANRTRSPMASVDGWGSDFRFVQLGALFNFKFGDNDSLAVLCQMKSKRDYTDATTRDSDFRDRDFEAAYWYINRVAFSYTHAFAK